MGGHPAHLAVASLVERNFQPAGGNRFALTNRRVARPQPDGFLHKFYVGRQGGAVVEGDAVAQGGQRLGRGFAFHLNIVDLAGALTRLGQLRLQRAVVGQHQQAFAVAIEPTGGIDARHRNKIFQRAAPGLVGKLRQHIIGFIEQDHSFWLAFFTLSGDLLCAESLNAMFSK